MDSYFITCILQGRSFSPAELRSRTDLSFDIQNELGDIGKVGRYKDKPIPFGSCEICIDSLGVDPLVLVLDLLFKNKEVIKECLVESISLTLNVEFSDQCNIEFGTQQLAKIVEMNVDFSVSCWKKSE